MEFCSVAPLAGAWIETYLAELASHESEESRPSRARGLKPSLRNTPTSPQNVAPLAGAWIETDIYFAMLHLKDVAPLAGAWIETKLNQNKKRRNQVAPLAGAWIETFHQYQTPGRALGRAPRGRVD